MFEIEIPFKIKGVPFRPEQTGMVKVDEKLIQTIASLCGWDGEARRLLTCALNGALHVASPQVEAITNPYSTYPNQHITFPDTPTTEIMIMACPTNGGDVWIQGGKGAAVDKVYRSRVRERLDSEGLVNHFEILEDNEISGYAVFAGGPGLWGKIEAVIGFTEMRDKLTGVEFIKQNETPGLGARIAEEWFKEQFRGKMGPFVLVPEGTAEAEKEVNAITGATRTSNFVLEIINQSLEDIKEGEWPKLR